MCVSDLLLRMARIDAIHTKAFEHQPTPPNKEYIFPEASGLSYFTLYGSLVEKSHKSG